MGQHTTLTDNDGAGLIALESGHGVVKKRVDCGVNTLTSGESYSVCKVLAGWLLTSVICKVITPEGAQATADLGLTGGDTDGIWDGSDGTINALDLNDTAGTVTCGAGDALAAALAAMGGLFFPADDTIDLLANDTMDAAVFEFTFHFKKLI